MNRQDLIAFSTQESPRQIRRVLVTMAFFAIWMGALFSFRRVIFDDLGVGGFLVAAAVPIVVLVATAVRIFYTMPKCPHCGTRLVGGLFQTAVASGNCGRCGRSFDD